MEYQVNKNQNSSHLFLILHVKLSSHCRLFDNGSFITELSLFC